MLQLKNSTPFSSVITLFPDGLVDEAGIVIEAVEDLRVFGPEQPVPPHLVSSADDLRW